MYLWPATLDACDPAHVGSRLRTLAKLREAEERAAARPPPVPVSYLTYELAV